MTQEISVNQLVNGEIDLNSLSDEEAIELHEEVASLAKTLIEDYLPSKNFPINFDIEGFLYNLCHLIVKLDSVKLEEYGYHCVSLLSGLLNCYRHFFGDEKFEGFFYAKEFPDLCKQDLTGVNLSNISLSGADLSKANLSSADLSKANLSDANLRGANLSGAYLSNANLTKANLTDAFLDSADLIKADLKCANLTNAWLVGAYLQNANLESTNLSGANLDGAGLYGVNLGSVIIDEKTSLDKGWFDLNSQLN